MTASFPPSELAGQPANTQAEAPFQRLALQLHHDLPRGEHRRTVLLTTANTAPQSAHAGLTLAYNLAEELQQPVLCVDAHVRGGDASRALGCQVAQGFTDLMVDPELRPRDLALQTSNPLLTFLPVGLAPPAGRARSLEQVARAVRSLEDGYDFVVLIGGPVLDDTMALAIAPHVGGVVLLAFENQTMLADLDQAQRALRFCKAERIALLFGTGSRT